MSVSRQSGPPSPLLTDAALRPAIPPFRESSGLTLLLGDGDSQQRAKRHARGAEADEDDDEHGLSECRREEREGRARDRSHERPGFVADVEPALVPSG